MLDDNELLDSSDEEGAEEQGGGDGERASRGGESDTLTAGTCSN